MGRDRLERETRARAHGPVSVSANLEDRERLHRAHAQEESSQGTGPYVSELGLVFLN